MEKIPKALAFDLDGTLAPSKSHLETDMATMISTLLNFFPIAVVSGASKEQFQLQFLKYLPQENTNLSNLYVFPQNGASLEVYKEGKWIVQYEENFSENEANKIISILKQVEIDFNLKETWINSLRYGHKIENRGAQVTFSALGQKAPLELKEKWDRNQEIRKKIKAFIDPLLPECEVRIGGTTSIDITKKGQNKAFAINKFMELLVIDKKVEKIEKNQLFFYGDALYPGGNDEIVKETGVVCEMVSNPQDTINHLRAILQSYEEDKRYSTVG